MTFLVRQGISEAETHRAYHTWWKPFFVCLDFWGVEGAINTFCSRAPDILVTTLFEIEPAENFATIVEFLITLQKSVLIPALLRYNWKGYIDVDRTCSFACIY